MPLNTSTNKQPYLRRVFGGKNPLILAICAALFVALNVYRLNNPLKVGEDAPDIRLTAFNGESFNMADINTPKTLVFYKKHALFSNYVINTTYKRALSSFKILQDKHVSQVIVIAEGFDSVDDIKKLLQEKDYAGYENIMFAADTKKAAKNYGIRSWPHLFVISSSNKIIYETKIGGADKVRQVLWRD